VFKFTPAAAARRPSRIETALVALAHAATHQTRRERSAIAQAVCGGDKVAAEIVERGAAPVGLTTLSGFGLQVTQSLVGEFVSGLQPLSAAAALVQRGLQINMGAASSMTIPARAAAPSTTVSWVGEGLPIPARSYVLSNAGTLAPKKFGLIVAISRELAKFASGEAVVRALLQEDAAAAFDGAVFSADAGDATIHAGMRNGIAAIAGFPGRRRMLDRA
jgi:HK97 family phage major capsid protein